MIDAHTHLENGDLSIEYVHKFIDAAKEKGITHLQILDHTHRFFEFKDCYKRVCEVSKLQEEWFLKKQKNSIDDYLKLIEALKKKLLTSMYVLALKFVIRLKQKVYYPPSLKTTILTF